MKNLLANQVKFYIVQERKDNEVQRVEPLYYNTTSRTFSTTSELQYATAYETFEEANKRKKLLEMLASFEEELYGAVIYHVVKNFTTNEIIETTEEIETV